MREPQTELDYYITCLKEVRRLRQEVGLVAADDFKKDMLTYFRIPFDMDSVFIEEVLLRLADTPAGTSQNRNDEYLNYIHNMRKGDSFTLYGRACLFRYHTGRREHLLDGFFEYVYEEAPSAYRTLDYNEAWTLATEGKLVLDVLRTT